jgi:hypothetical protein
LLTLYALEVRAASSVQALRTEVDRHILLRVRLFCNDTVDPGFLFLY